MLDAIALSPRLTVIQTLFKSGPLRFSTVDAIVIENIDRKVPL